MEVEVEALVRKYRYKFGEINVDVIVRGSMVKEIHIYDKRNGKCEDYHSFNLEIPIEFLGMLSEALEDLRYRTV